MNAMTDVITEPCSLCKCTGCIGACLVDVFRDGKKMLVIDTEERIYCRLCVPECPANASYPDDDVPEDQPVYFEIPDPFSKLWPVITCTKRLGGDDTWKTTKAQDHLLDLESAN